MLGWRPGPSDGGGTSPKTQTCLCPEQGLQAGCCQGARAEHASPWDPQGLCPAAVSGCLCDAQNSRLVLEPALEVMAPFRAFWTVTKWASIPEVCLALAGDLSGGLRGDQGPLLFFSLSL